ncbi:MAG: hypothetical protein V4619_09380 [Bacteroidota bacterium]
MKTRFLFPHQWRKVGVCLFILGLVVIGLYRYFDDQIVTWQFKRHHAGLEDYEELIPDVFLLLLIFGLFLIAFTKEKIEDEQLMQLRLDSLQWSIYLNYAILVVCILAVDSWHFFINIAAHYIFTPLVFFIIRFRWAVYQSNRLLNSED